MQAALLPYIQGYAWALDTIRDLWLMGAPDPSPQLDGVERRILHPGQFKRWWADVQQRMGVALTPNDVIR